MEFKKAKFKGNSYRLIKKYPGLPTDWEVGMIVKRSDEGCNLGDMNDDGVRVAHFAYFPVDVKYSNHPDLVDAKALEIENSPEYWEEI